MLGALISLGEHKFVAIDDIKQMILEKVGKAMDEFFEAMSESSFGVAIRERAKAEGKEEGKAEGDAATRRFLLGRRWQKRYGQELDAAMLDRIAALSQEQYVRVFDAVEDGVLSPAQVLALLDA